MNDRWRRLGMASLLFAAAYLLFAHRAPSVASPQPLWIWLDASRSMLSSDVSPNRLQRSKAIIGELLDDSPLLQNRPVGLVVFAGSAELLVPPTRHRSLLLQRLAEVTPDSVAPGPTDLLSPFQLSLFQADRQTEQAASSGPPLILLFSDGGDRELPQVDLDKLVAAPASKEPSKPIELIAIGVGASEATAAPSSPEPTTHFRPGGLRKLAQRTGGAYLAASDPQFQADLERQLAAASWVRENSRGLGELSLLGIVVLWWGLEWARRLGRAAVAPPSPSAAPW